MHLTTEELLDLRDGESRSETAATHVAECEACAAEIERLRRVAEQLRALPSLQPERDGWPRLRDRIQAEQRRRRSRSVGVAALALAASLVLAVIVPGLMKAPAEEPAVTTEPGPAPVAATRPEEEEEIMDLVAESQDLEEALRGLHPEGRVMDIWEATAVADLEDQIGLVDSRLAGYGRDGLTPEEEARLWRTRVNLMNELVRTRGGQVIYTGL
jgi:hypothetical protein